MKHQQDYSDEFLNAYIDGELDQEETGQLLDELRYNTSLNERITNLQKVREMVRYAYTDALPDIQHNPAVTTKTSRSKLAIAASLILSLGIALGWGLHLHSRTADGLLQIAEAVQIKSAVVDKSQEVKLLLHVTTNAKHKINTILDETEALLKSYKALNRKVKIDVLTNGKGLALLRANHSPYSKRIQALQEKYKNLTFKACAKAIKRARKLSGKNVPMLPDTIIVPSAIGEVMKKQQEGWSYIKI